ncbi:MAG: hypothetical protein WC238_05075 [Parcubacteria group bacterium]|jgi:hypothetical protein
MENNEKTYKAGEVMSMLEQINDGIKIIAEDQLDIKKDIKTIKSDVDDIKSDIVDIKRDLKGKVDSSKFEILEGKLAQA